MAGCAATEWRFPYCMLISMVSLEAWTFGLSCLGTDRNQRWSSFKPKATCTRFHNPMFSHVVCFITPSNSPRFLLRFLSERGIKVEVNLFTQAMSVKLGYQVS